MKLLQLALLTLTIAAPAAAQNVGQFSFDLDVPEGHFSYWAAENIGDAESMEAEIAVTELRRHRRYAPVFGLHLTGAGGASEGGRISLMLTPTRNRRALTGFLSVFQPGSEAPVRSDLPGTFALDDTLSVQIDWSSGESVVATLAGESMAVPRIVADPGPVPRVCLHGSDEGVPTRSPEVGRGVGPGEREVSRPTMSLRAPLVSRPSTP